MGFKVAAKMGPRYLKLLEANEPVIAKNVTENLFDRHIAPVFLGRGTWKQLPVPSSWLLAFPKMNYKGRLR